MTAKGSIRRFQRIEFILLSVTILWLLAACTLFGTPGGETALTPVTPTPTVETPILTETAAPTPESTSQLMQSVTVYYETITVTQPESKPDLVYAKVKGNLPDPCSKIVNKTFYWVQDHSVELVITAERDLNVMCAQVLTPFEDVIEIDITGKPAGMYTFTAGESQATLDYQGSPDKSNTSSCPPRIPGSNLYVKSASEDSAGFCFLYPFEFNEVASASDNRITLLGPPRQVNQRTINVKVEFELYTSEDDKDLREFVTGYLKTEELPLQTPMEEITFAGQKSVKVQTKSEAGVTKSLFFVHNKQVFRLSFLPAGTDNSLVANDINACYDLIERSWVILDENK